MPADIRPARAEDLPVLLALYRHLNTADPTPPPDLTRVAWQAMLAQPGLTVSWPNRQASLSPPAP
ncbi:hypothetical protein JMJ56_23475 [Belnapia sp. T18]|uniref:GNAT family N-acetyltransferase n=1 Tax=Belnapia arida TaxID=2804533 RepID=A0ABS1UAM6_9PROT|nr:hypothetical protein [Belnapia arida]MBL6080979.1 hypothetical protein [Belnapia arida]